MRAPDRPAPWRARLERLDMRRWSALGVVLLFVGGTLALALAFVFGAGLLNLEGQESVESLITHAAEAPWAPLWVMLVFSGLALAGVPQFILIAATVVVFGAWQGALYSWIATLSSALLGFALGRLFARQMLRRYGGERVNRLSALIARHAILSSALVRNVPSGPFIVVNVAAGATPMSLAKYTLGTAAGIVPKIAFIALLGTGIIRALEERRPEDFFFVVAVLAIWIAAGVLLRRYWGRLTRRTVPDRPSAPPPPAP